jgi:hypothetical protein
MSVQLLRAIYSPVGKTKSCDAHLGPDVGKLAGQEMPLIPMVLDGSERMLCQPLTQLHPSTMLRTCLLRIAPNTALHIVQQIPIHPTGDAAALFTARTLVLHRALRTNVGGIVLDVSSLLGGLEAEGELLSRWAPIAILIEVIAEVFFAEGAMLAAGRGLGFGDEGRDAHIQTGFDILAMVVTHICQDFKIIHTE